ncbi:hemolysin family protein [Geobacter sp. AOG2]|uniref:hemolysin family protein n=1 Tax=Geobacter sp. AOG2 TaxID=1566347 RepID=UPI001CC4E823|nr:hemolysin family protein [Geobacter sp. AOG2]GFE60956.1 transporter [Geobacter sp. AOG2]
MDTVLVEILVIAIMIVLNGFFACSEFAIISVRKSRVAQLVDEGDNRASLIEVLQQDPHRLLALVQVGVTLTGATASTMGGIIAVDYLRPWFQNLGIGFLAQTAEPVAVTGMVVIISYLLLILGELVPKAIGLQYADAIALRVARPISVLARVGSVLVTLLTVSSKAVMRILHISANREPFISREEVQHIVAEGHESGVFSETEHEYIRNVFEFTHTCVREVMVPRTRMVALDLSTPPEQVVATLMENMYSRYPVYRGSIEEIAGVVHGKDILGRLVAGKQLDLAAIMLPPVFVPEGKKVNELLKEMQRNRNQMVLVVDEYGGLSGLVTTEDLIEELVGEIEDEHDVGEQPTIMRMEDGSLMVDGLLSVFDLAEALEIKLDEELPFETVAGMILQELGRFPLKGETVEWHGYRFLCDEVTQTAVLKVHVTALTPEPA